MTEEFIKNCPLCFRKPQINEYSTNGTRHWEIACQNESHACLVMHLTKGGAIRRWNNGIEREPVSELVKEKQNGTH